LKIKIYQQQKFQAASQDVVHIYEQKEVSVVCEDQEVEEYYKFYIIQWLRLKYPKKFIIKLYEFIKVRCFSITIKLNTV